MRVINHKHEELRRVVCDNCKSELEYTKEDIKYGAYGVPYVKCPVCGEEVDLEDWNSIVITANNVKFPHYFSHTDHENALKVDDDTVNRYIKECISTLRKNKSRSVFMGTGDTMVFVFRLDEDGWYGEYDIFVAKDYYELPVEFESEDCE